MRVNLSLLLLRALQSIFSLFSSLSYSLSLSLIALKSQPCLSLKAIPQTGPLNLLGSHNVKGWYTLAPLFPNILEQHTTSFWFICHPYSSICSLKSELVFEPLHLCLPQALQHNAEFFPSHFSQYTCSVAPSSSFSLSRGELNVITGLFYNVFNFVGHLSPSFLLLFVMTINREITLRTNNLQSYHRVIGKIYTNSANAHPSNTHWNLVLIWIFNKHQLGKPLSLDLWRNKKWI